MSAAAESNVWLENSAGEQFPIVGTCALGRAPTNQIVLADHRASRQHALVRAQEQNQYWLVDLQSRHGTFLNGRRVGQPALLLDGDSIGIGAGTLTFRQPAFISPGTAGNPGFDPAALGLRLDPCWLLLAHFEGSAGLPAAVSDEEISGLTDGWLAACRQLLEECGGSIDKVFGDGCLACWPTGDGADGQVVQAVAALQRWQDDTRLPFRIVLHYGTVARGGAALGPAGLAGREVNFILRMEKLAGQLREPRLLSEAAASLLAGQLELTAAGRHPLPGYEGEFGFAKF